MTEAFEVVMFYSGIKLFKQAYLPSDPRVQCNEKSSKSKQTIAKNGKNYKKRN